MTVSRFERMARNSPFEIELLEAAPIRKLRSGHSRKYPRSDLRPSCACRGFSQVCAIFQYAVPLEGN